jgi:hypothetical protein
VAIDQTSSRSTSDPIPSAAIENEFPTYRAISSLAVFSLVLGLLSVFAFANPWFLLLTAASVGCGLQALRKIRRLPEILTGASIARVGIGAAVVFGGSALTHEVVEDVRTTMDAKAFVNHLIGVIKNEPADVILWYQENVDFRKKSTPEIVAESVKNTKNPAAVDPYGTKIKPILMIKERLKTPGQDLHYSKVESKLIIGLTIYAYVLIEVDGPVTTQYPKPEYGLIQMVKNPGAGKFDWVVKEVKYPYTPSSTVVEAPHSDDDGHGH